nr:MAG TPA: hypothetical protein [Caudoviricetes sp.]
MPGDKYRQVSVVELISLVIKQNEAFQKGSLTLV